MLLKNLFNRTLAITCKKGETLRIKPNEVVEVEEDCINYEMRGKEKLGILSITPKPTAINKKKKEDK